MHSLCSKYIVITHRALIRLKFILKYVCICVLSFFLCVYSHEVEKQWLLHQYVGYYSPHYGQFCGCDVCGLGREYFKTAVSKVYIVYPYVNTSVQRCLYLHVTCKHERAAKRHGWTRRKRTERAEFSTDRRVSVCVPVWVVDCLCCVRGNAACPLSLTFKSPPLSEH